MHARELVELAAIVAFECSHFLRLAPPVPDRVLAEYWAASRCRIDRWGIQLCEYTAVIEQPRPDQLSQHWAAIQPVLVEILLSEMLTRVWTAMSAAFDVRLRAVHMEPVARAIHVAHLEARNRTLQLMVFGRGFALQDAVALNRLRRRIESWTDSLLAPIHLEHGVGSLAFNEERCGQFADDLSEQRRQGLDEPARQLTMSSLRTAFHCVRDTPAPNGDLNRDIAGSVLACLGRPLFDDTGLLGSGWLDRMQQMTDDTQGMIDQLIELEGIRWPDRLARHMP